MLIGKLLTGLVKAIGRFLSSSAGKKTIVATTLIGAGLAGNGVRQAVKAKKINKEAFSIHEEALAMYKLKYDETNNIISKLGFEVKNSISSIKLYVKSIEKIKSCPSFAEIYTEPYLPTISIIEIKKMSMGFDMALAGVGGGVAGGVPGLVLCGASLSVLAFAALGCGVVLSIKGGKVVQKAVKSLKEAKEEAEKVVKLVDFYNKIDGASKKLTKAINMVNSLLIKKLDKLANLIERNNNYPTYSRSEKDLVGNNYKLVLCLVDMCEKRLVNRQKDDEVVNSEEIDMIVANANRLCNVIKHGFLDKIFA